MKVAQAVWPLLETTRGKKPEQYYVPARKLRRRLLRLIDVIGNAKPISMVIPGIKIKSHTVAGEVLNIEGVKVYYKGSQAQVRYTLENTALTPRTGYVRVTFAGKLATRKVMLGPREAKQYTDGFSVDSEGYKPLSIKVYRDPRGRLVYDSVSQTVPVGVLDDSYKPTTEYPVEGAENAVLDIAVDWSESVYLYPENGANLYVYDTALADGFVVVDRTPYRRTDQYARLRIGFQLTYTGDRVPASYELWGVMVGVVYDDLRHVSLYDVTDDASVSNSSGSLSDTSRSFSASVTVPLPLDFYGHVFVIVAYNIYSGRTLVYAGGPVWQVDLFRLRMP